MRDLNEIICEIYAADVGEMEADLLEGVGLLGSLLDHAMVRALVRQAFVSGVLCALDDLAGAVDCDVQPGRAGAVVQQLRELQEQAAWDEWKGGAA
jgi:hypothetical protein